MTRPGVHSPLEPPPPAKIRAMTVAAHVVDPGCLRRIYDMLSLSRITVSEEAPNTWYFSNGVYRTSDMAN